MYYCVMYSFLAPLTDLLVLHFCPVEALSDIFCSPSVFCILSSVLYMDYLIATL